ncbi:hypothetical protein K402DRAFT_17639, partial [Aulographum hederae CBS 113979]
MRMKKRMSSVRLENDLVSLRLVCIILLIICTHKQDYRSWLHLIVFKNLIILTILVGSLELETTTPSPAIAHETLAKRVTRSTTAPFRNSHTNFHSKAYAVQGEGEDEEEEGQTKLAPAVTHEIPERRNTRITTTPLRVSRTVSPSEAYAVQDVEEYEEEEEHIRLADDSEDESESEGTDHNEVEDQQVLAPRTDFPQRNNRAIESDNPEDEVIYAVSSDDFEDIDAENSDDFEDIDAVGPINLVDADEIETATTHGPAMVTRTRDSIIDREGGRQFALDAFQKAVRLECNCEQPNKTFSDDCSSMARHSEFWKLEASERICPGAERLPFPLGLPTLINRSEDEDDFRGLNWKSLLTDNSADGRSLGGLSIWKSEEELIKRIDGPVEIRREWDIDSDIFRATTLAVFRGGFNFAYRPHFLRRITQNQRVKIGGVNIHKCKQLMIGTGAFAGGQGYYCHVVFPHMDIASQGETHLSDAAQAVWIDDIILPALRNACPSSILAHHPLSFKDADGKAKVKLEQTSTLDDTATGGGAMDIRYTIPERYLEDFWANVLRYASSAVGPGVQRKQFRNPILCVSAHNLKLNFKSDTLTAARDLFNKTFDLSFRTDRPDWIPEDERWHDIAVEDIPDTPNDISVTLLQKTHCLERWTGHFHHPERAGSYTKVSTYCWGLTRDAGTASVELSPTNPLRAEGGMAYHKAYSIFKERFATPLKGLGPFDNTQFEGLAYSQEMLEKWYKATNSTANAKKREQLLSAFLRAKKRVAIATKENPKAHFGIRQEYRVSHSLFMQLEEPEPPEDQTKPNTNNEAHRLYWQVSTRDASVFIANQVNRFLLAAEVLICRAAAGHRGREQASDQQQFINSVMLSACLRTIRLVISGDVASYPSLWKQWSGRRQRNRDSNSDEEEQF